MYICTRQSELAGRANKQFRLYTDDDHSIAIFVDWAVEGTLSDPQQRYAPRHVGVPWHSARLPAIKQFGVQAFTRPARAAARQHVTRHRDHCTCVHALSDLCTCVHALSDLCTCVHALSRVSASMDRLARVNRGPAEPLCVTRGSCLWSSGCLRST